MISKHVHESIRSVVSRVAGGVGLKNRCLSSEKEQKLEHVIYPFVLNNDENVNVLRFCDKKRIAFIIEFKLIRKSSNWLFIISKTF